MIVGVNTFRNFIETGYPFVESIISHLPFCDEYYVNDGGSTDGTLEVLERMEETFPKIRLFRMPDTENVRWDSASKQSNAMIAETDAEWIFLGNGDEVFHEGDVAGIRRYVEASPYWVLRPTRREIKDDWSKLGFEVYHPARFAKNAHGIYMDWNAYGGDEFLYDTGWYDPHRLLLLPYILYHVYNMFPENKLFKRRKDATYIAPGDRLRVAIYEQIKGGTFSKVNPNNICPHLPAIIRGLVGMQKYAIREELFDRKWLRKTTGLDY